MTDIPDVSEHAHYGVIYEDRHGSIWIGVNGTGLLRYDPSTRTSKIYTRAVLDGGSTISGMAEDHSGNFSFPRVLLLIIMIERMTALPK